MAALVADGVGDVEREVVATFLSCHAEQLLVLLLGEVLLEVHVEGGTAREVLDVWCAVQLELVDDVERVVLYDVEVGVVAVARYEVAVLAVPLGVLDADVLGRNHLAVEEHVLGAVLLVVLLYDGQDALHELLVLVVGVNLQAHELGSLHEAVDADGEVLAVHRDVASVEEWQHAVGLQLLEVLVVGELHFVADVDDVGEELLVVLAVVDGVLDAAVEVDGEHGLGSCAHAAGTEGVGEAVVLNLVAQTAAGGEGVGVVAHVGEEGVAFGVHLCGEVAPFLVAALAVVSEQRHGLYGEGEDGLAALGVEPRHEALLEPGEAVPVGLRTVGEVEVAEEGLEVVLVVVGDVPEHGLEVACSRRLVDGVDDLLEAVGDDLVDGALAQGEVNDLVGVLVVVEAVLLADEVVQVHEELWRGARAGEHGADDEDHVDESAAERLEVCGGRGVAADGRGAADEPWVHGDGGAVGGDGGLVVLVDEVVVEQVDVLVCKVLAEHLLDAVGKQTTVQTDEVGLGKFADEGCDVFVFYVCVCVKL